MSRNAPRARRAPVVATDGHRMALPVAPGSSRALALLTLLLLWGAGLAKAAPPEAPKHVKLVAAPYLTSAPLFIALDLGLFAAEGLDVELVELPGGPASLPALAQGQVDVVGAMVVPALFNLVERGAAIRIVAGRARESRDGCVSSAAVARKELLATGRLAGAATLRGLRLSTDRTGPPFFYASSLLGSAGLSLHDVEVSDIDIAARGEALARGLIDVSLAFEPSLTQILDAGAAAIWIPGRDIAPDFQYTFLLFGPRLLVDDRDAGRRFVRAYLAGVARYLDEGKSPRLIELLVARTRLDAGLLRRACWPATARDGAIDATSLERYQAWALGEGLVDARLDAVRLVDSGFLDDATTPANQGR